MSSIFVFIVLVFAYLYYLIFFLYSRGKKHGRIKYGGLTSDDEDTGRRTRGKKIDYAAVLASDSDDELRRRLGKPAIESDDDDEEYVANEEDLQEAEGEADVEEKEESNEEDEDDLPIVKRKKKMISSDDEDDQPIVSSKKKKVAELESDDDNPIDSINKDMEDMDEEEMEKMMNEEEYANKQLQLVAQQIEKEKKRQERKAKKDKELELQRQLEEFKKFAEEEQIEAPPDDCEKSADANDIPATSESNNELDKKTDQPSSEARNLAMEKMESINQSALLQRLHSGGKDNTMGENAENLSMPKPAEPVGLKIAQGLFHSPNSGNKDFPLHPQHNLLQALQGNKLTALSPKDLSESRGTY